MGLMRKQTENVATKQFLWTRLDHADTCVAVFDRKGEGSLLVRCTHAIPLAFWDKAREDCAFGSPAHSGRQSANKALPGLARRHGCLPEIQLALTRVPKRSGESGPIGLSFVICHQFTAVMTWFCKTYFGSLLLRTNDMCFTIKGHKYA